MNKLRNFAIYLYLAFGLSVGAWAANHAVPTSQSFVGSDSGGLPVASPYTPLPAATFNNNSSAYLRKTGSAASLTNFPTLNQNTSGTAAGLTLAYIDWALSSGGASILHKPVFAGYSEAHQWQSFLGYLDTISDSTSTTSSTTAASSTAVKAAYDLANGKLTATTFNSYSSSRATKTGVQAESYTAADDTGTANAYAITVSPAPTLATYSWFSFKALNANTGASTLAINGGAAKAIKKWGGTVALIGGEIAVGQIVRVIYDGTNFQMQSQSALGTNAAFVNRSTCIGSIAISYINGARQRIKLSQSAACTITFTPPSSGSFNVLLEVDQSTTSPYNGTITLSGIRVPSGITPVPTATSGATDYYSILYNDLKGTTELVTNGQSFQ